MSDHWPHDRVPSNDVFPSSVLPPQDGHFSNFQILHLFLLMISDTVFTIENRMNYRFQPSSFAREPPHVEMFASVLCIMFVAIVFQCRCTSISRQKKWFFVLFLWYSSSNLTRFPSLSPSLLGPKEGSWSWWTQHSFKSKELDDRPRVWRWRWDEPNTFGGIQCPWPSQWGLCVRLVGWFNRKWVVRLWTYSVFGWGVWCFLKLPIFTIG